MYEVLDGIGETDPVVVQTDTELKEGQTVDVKEQK
jgi:hypothetical protein